MVTTRIVTKYLPTNEKNYLISLDGSAQKAVANVLRPIQYNDEIFYTNIINTVIFY